MIFFGTQIDVGHWKSRREEINFSFISIQLNIPVLVYLCNHFSQHVQTIFPQEHYLGHQTKIHHYLCFQNQRDQAFHQDGILATELVQRKQTHSLEHGDVR